MLVEEEAALFLVHGCIELQQETGEGGKFKLSPSRVSWLRLASPRRASRPCLPRHGTGDDKIDGWYLDTGATHHMTGQREFFSNLDFDVRFSQVW